MANAPAASVGACARPDREFDIIFFPIIDWDERFQRPQQLASRFAEAGHRVFYLNHHFLCGDRPYELRNRRERLWEVHFRGPQIDIYRSRPTGDQAEQYILSLRELEADLELRPAVSVVELPFWWPIAARARDRFLWPVVYDCMDLHAGFATNAAEMLALEDELLERADLVAVTSRVLEDHARPRARRTVRIPNGCDYLRFANVEARPRSGAPVVGYHGAIADWFDGELLAEVARRRPDWRFLLVGGVEGENAAVFEGLANIEQVGEVPHDELPGWLARMDVSVIPFRRTALTEAVNPVKLYESLAAGRPVVSVPLPEVVALGERIVRTATTAESFESEIAAALGESGEEAVLRRRAFAREQTWQSRFEQLAPELGGTFARVSVLVTVERDHHDVEMLGARLARAARWPNLEIRMVESRGSDEVRERVPRERWPGPPGGAESERLQEALEGSLGHFVVVIDADVDLDEEWLRDLLRQLALLAKGAGPNPAADEEPGTVPLPAAYLECGHRAGWVRAFVRHPGEPQPRSGEMLVVFRGTRDRGLLASPAAAD